MVKSLLRHWVLRLQYSSLTDVIIFPSIVFEIEFWTVLHNTYVELKSSNINACSHDQII